MPAEPLRCSRIVLWWLTLPVLLLGTVAGGVVWYSGWQLPGSLPADPDHRQTAAHSGAHEDDDHNDPSLSLSEQARKNLGLTPEFLEIVRLSTFRRSITVPAMVISRPGRTQIQVSAPLNGIITHVHAVTGESVLPGSLLFEIRLTHEDLVQSQTDFLKTLGELDVEEREIERLKFVSQSGVISERSLLERQYQRERLQSREAAQAEALRLHGLSERQVDDIRESRRLLRELSITVPFTYQHSEDEELPLLIEELNVRMGQVVHAGDPLCTVADHSRLFIEGRAFEQDLPTVLHAGERDWTMTAVFDAVAGDSLPGGAGQRERLEGLRLTYVANVVDRDSRTLPFFVDLQNTIVRDDTNQEGQRFVWWKYRPGQRLQLLVPAEEWPDQIVVPAAAVAVDGANAYVFRQHGNRFQRTPVHLKYVDQHAAVIASDGSLRPGAVIAMRSAWQMQMALKSQSGGVVDPHAGHNH